MTSRRGEIERGTGWINESSSGGLRSGDHEAFDGLVRFASNRLYGIAYRILRDQYLAEDALQQALINIWNELPKLRDPDRFDAWTYRVIVRAATAEARRAGRGGPTSPLLPDDADVSRAPDEYPRRRRSRRSSSAASAGSPPSSGPSSSSSTTPA